MVAQLLLISPGRSPGQGGRLLLSGAAAWPQTRKRRLWARARVPWCGARTKPVPCFQDKPNRRNCLKRECLHLSSALWPLHKTTTTTHQESTNSSGAHHHRGPHTTCLFSSNTLTKRFRPDVRRSIGTWTMLLLRMRIPDWKRLSRMHPNNKQS